MTAAILSSLIMNPSTVNGQESTTIGGYGELHYNLPDSSKRGTLDFHRFVVYIGHTFNESISFKSEIEIEHTKIEATGTGGAEGGEVAIEQAYIDWHFDPHIGMKAGILLLPIGIINQIHEPPTFNGVERPNVDQFIIPTTWREAGLGIYGLIAEGINYQLYVVAGLHAVAFSGNEGIRGGRQEALESSTANPSVTGRLEYVPLPELKLGTSFFVGNTTDVNAQLGTGTLSLISGDIRYTFHGFSLRAVGAFESLSDAESINMSMPAPAVGDIADQMYGFYFEGAYNLMPCFVQETEQSLNPFVRYEKYNTQAGVTGFIANPVNNRNEITIGVTYKPTYNTAFKIDYQFLNNAASLNTKQLNVGIGYSF